jgi:lipoprotein NlpI
MKSQPTEEIAGWIQRANINSNLSDQIKRSNPSQQADLYAENGFWYDALSTLAIQRRDFPTNPAIKENWQSMLKSVDLEGLADRTFVK